MTTRLIFSSRLYLGDGMKGKKLDKIKYRLLYKPLLAKVYILTFARNPKDQLEFFDARQMTQRYFQALPQVHGRDGAQAGYQASSQEHTEGNLADGSGGDIRVIGIAKDYGDALKLVERITRECLRDRGDCNLKEYLLC